MTVAGNTIPADTQHTFLITDSNIKSTDIILTQLILLGADTKGISESRAGCDNGSAWVNFLSSQTYSENMTIGYQYVILRPI